LEEQTIILTEDEFNSFQKLDGKKVRKLIYYYDYNEITAEIGIFQDSLKGLVMIDFEFATVEEKDNFKMPDFCLADVTQEVFLAGGMICGKSYEDIENDLKRFNYKKLSLG
jgi:CYTH domain-containing protein